MTERATNKYDHKDNQQEWLQAQVTRMTARASDKNFCKGNQQEWP